MQSSTQFKNVASARTLLDPPDLLHDAWDLNILAGRFVEISGAAETAALTICTDLIYETQARGGLAVWIGGAGSTFYPPDLADSGIDLAALPVVRVPDAITAARAADTLIRSGGFAVVALDIRRMADLSIGVQTRLVGLAKKHHTALIALTHRNARETAGGSLVSLRAETEKRRIGHDCFRCDVQVVKDKRRVPGWRHTEMCHGADGLC